MNRWEKLAKYHAEAAASCVEYQQWDAARQHLRSAQECLEKAGR